MYSLYRAWLSLGPCAAGGPIPTPNLAAAATTPPQCLPAAPIPIGGGGGVVVPLNLTTTSTQHLPGLPDITLQVGPSLTQFSAHKAVLSAHSGFFKAALLHHGGGTPISVPNVNVDEFSSLLTFMYTGYLDLNISNIYSILLATHMLHMPRALEVCRSFLLQSQAQAVESAAKQHQPQRTNIIKPIPSRKAALPTQEIYSPTFSSLRKSEDTPFKVVDSRRDYQKASTSKVQVDTTETNVKKAIEVTLKKSSAVEKPKQSKKHHQTSNNDKVIIDIACCDGPVKFHRVINKNYGLQQQQSTATDTFHQPEEVNNKNAAMNKAMTENIRDKTIVSDENDNQSNNAVGGGGATAAGSSNEIFTCLYCNHTFKSQYCYQKHARRHLNPVSLEAKAITISSTSKDNNSNSAATNNTTAISAKREVKLLDMNVQYYPCKTCGSKFPSYYFVHKHRKLCHAEEMMAENSINNKNNSNTNEIEVVNVDNVNNNTTDSSCSSAIDVEAINSSDK